MGVPLTGYQTARLIRSSGQSRVYEAVRESDGRSVIVASEGRPSPLFRLDLPAEGL